MNYQIAQQFLLGAHKLLTLLRLSDNRTGINHEIIPKFQRQQVNTFHRIQDVEKRLLARSFLFETVQREYDVADFELQYDLFRKPFLKSAPHIHFNFSYSNDLVLVGISRDHRIGVDVEFIDLDFDVDNLASEIMNEKELSMFHSLDEPSRAVFFFNLFSTKEAIVKAFGVGLQLDIKSLDTTNKNPFLYNTCLFQTNPINIYDHNYVASICLENTKQH